MPDLVRYGNPNAITDMAVGALLLDATRRGAAMNVQINLDSIADAEFVERARGRLDAAADKARTYLEAVKEGMKAAGLDF